MRRSDFDYVLPPELIAQAPLEVRSASRLLTLSGADGAVTHRRFADIVELLNADDLLVVNDTRVLAARLFGTKDSGGRVELLIERILGAHEALAQARTSKALQPGRFITLDNPQGEALQVTVGERHGELYELSFPHPVTEILERFGRVPLPPYIRRAADAADLERYQTVFARRAGAVAAPTAGLHFDAATLDAIDAKGIARATVTLHVGAGTFAPVRVDDVREHRMHGEWCEVAAPALAAISACRARRGRVVAVGTTVLRALESAAAAAGPAASDDAAADAERAVRWAPFAGETQLFIYPGFRFRAVDALLTNFHVPQSSLLMLVCAFAGTAHVLHAYAEAVAQRYRFFSYGDAMFITRAPAIAHVATTAVA